MTSRITDGHRDGRFQACANQVGRARILAVPEPRPSTMKAGVMKDRMPASLQQADKDFLLKREPRLGRRGCASRRSAIAPPRERPGAPRRGDRRPRRGTGEQVLVMSNGDSGVSMNGLPQRLAYGRPGDPDLIIYLPDSTVRRGPVKAQH